jgi:hypothetical protein
MCQGEVVVIQNKFLNGFFLQKSLVTVFSSGTGKYSIQIYHVWEGYLRKIPVLRRKISRAEYLRKIPVEIRRGKFSLKTCIFRKYPSQT